MSALKRALRSLFSFLNPEDSGSGGLDGWHYAALCLFLALVVIAQSYGSTIEGSLSGFWSGGKYAPEPALLHISGVQWIVHSRYDWDSGLLGSTAIDDVDYGLGYGRSVPARLPGASWITYRYVGAGYIPGSGYYITFQAPNHGRFAMLHLQWLKWYPTMHGGQQVGVTGWPTDPVYAGGGPAGPADAHYCLTYDWLGEQWFLHGIYHRPFPLTKWQAYRRSIHKRPFPYRNPKTHKLLWQASIFQNHQKLGSPTNTGRWYGPTRTRHLGFMKYGFTKGVAYGWTATGAVKVVLR